MCPESCKTNPEFRNAATAGRHYLCLRNFKPKRDDDQTHLPGDGHELRRLRRTGRQDARRPAGRQAGGGEFRGSNGCGGVRSRPDLARTAGTGGRRSRIRTDHRPEGGRRAGRTRTRGTLPRAQAPCGGGPRTGRAAARRRDALHAPPVVALGDVAARHPAGIRLRARFLRRSLAPAAPPLGQHGHARGAEHGHRLRFQPLQPPLPRILDLARHRAACLFRGFGRRDRLRAARAAARGAGQGRHDGGDPEALRTAARYGAACRSGG